MLIAVTFAPNAHETVDLASYTCDQCNKAVTLTDALNGPQHRLGAITRSVSEVDVAALCALSARFSLAVLLAVAVGSVRNISNL